MVFIPILTHVHLENFSHCINNLHQNINFPMEEESSGELVILDMLLKCNTGKITVLAYRKPSHTDQYLHYCSLHETKYKESDFSSLFNRAYFIITNKENLTNENARIKQVLKIMDIKKALLLKSLK